MPSHPANTKLGPNRELTTLMNMAHDNGYDEGWRAAQAERYANTIACTVLGGVAGFMVSVVVQLV